MMSIVIGGCKVDVMPIVNGVESEAEKVEKAYGGYEAYGVSLGIEGIQAIRSRATITDEFEVSELDLVYAKRMEELTGECVSMPSPAICKIVDLVSSDGGNVIALDMNDEDFTEMYCETVPALDFVKEHRLAKKGIKRRFKSTVPADFALEWDAYVNTVKGYRRVCENRERHIAEEILDTAKYKGSLLAIVEVERAKGVFSILEGSHVRQVRRVPCFGKGVLRYLRRGSQGAMSDMRAA